MQYELLAFLRCPVTGKELQFQLLEEASRTYDTTIIQEIITGLLFSPAGFIFPILQGIPRLLVEAVYDYRSFLEEHVTDYQKRLKKLEQDQGTILRHCVNKNKKTKASFEWEWSFLNAEKKDKIWEKETDTLETIFFNETGLAKNACRDSFMADIGCGHGLMTQAMAAQTTRPVLGVELSKAVETAYTNNRYSNAWFVQADLQYLPFDRQLFDLIYSSGVIHHTDNTHASLLKIEKLLKSKGLLCIWLYHPQKNLYHRVALILRKRISKLPIRLAFLVIALFIFPFTFLIKKIRNKRPLNYREELIYLFDSFTPEFRDEVPAEQAINWLKELQYTSIHTTTADQYGYSLAAVKF